MKEKSSGLFCYCFFFKFLWNAACQLSPMEVRVSSIVWNLWFISSCPYSPRYRIQKLNFKAYKLSCREYEAPSFYVVYVWAESWNRVLVVRFKEISPHHLYQSDISLLSFRRIIPNGNKKQGKAKISTRANSLAKLFFSSSHLHLTAHQSRLSYSQVALLSRGFSKTVLSRHGLEYFGLKFNFLHWRFFYQGSWGWLLMGFIPNL